MPTGYTDIIGKGATFEQFVWRCARAFGALILMRDDPSGASIPDEFKPPTQYYEKVLREAEAKATELAGVTPEQAGAMALADHAAEYARWQERQNENSALAEKYDAMLDRVRAWHAPSPEHVGLRTFMRDQIIASKDSDCGYDSVPPLAKTGAEWLRDQLASVSHDLGYAKERIAAEIQRTNERNEWLRTLRASVPYQGWKDGR